MGGSPVVNLEAIQNMVIGNGRKMKLLKAWDGWITDCDAGSNTGHCHWFLKKKTDCLPHPYRMGWRILGKMKNCCGSLIVLG